MKLKKKIFSIVLATVAMAGIATQGMLSASAATSAKTDKKIGITSYQRDFTGQYCTSGEYGRTMTKNMKTNANLDVSYCSVGADVIKRKSFQYPFHEFHMEVNNSNTYGKVTVNEQYRGSNYTHTKYDEHNDKITLYVNALYKSKGYARTETNQYYSWWTLCTGDKVEVNVNTPGHPERATFRMTNNTINYAAQATYNFNQR